MLSRRMVLFLAGFFTASCFMLLPGKVRADNGDSRVHLEAGFEGFSRDLDFDESVFAGLPFPGGIESAESLRLLAKLSIRIIDPVEIYAVGGGGDLQIDELGFNSDFSGMYGGGVHLILYRERGEMPFEVFADYRFLRYEAKDRVFFQPTETVDTNGDGFADTEVPIPPGNAGELLDEEIRWTEHQAKFGVRGKHDQWEPYGGVRFSFIKGKDRLPSQFGEVNVDFKQSDTVGLFAGAAYYLSRSERAAVFAELGIIDQFSLAAGFRVGF